jgi:hypothetical protein
MDVAGPGGDGMPVPLARRRSPKLAAFHAEASTRGRELEAMGKQMCFVFLPGDDANIARFGDEIAAAIPRPFGTEIAFLHTEGSALICNPVDQKQYPLVGSIGRSGAHGSFMMKIPHPLVSRGLLRLHSRDSPQARAWGAGP